MNQNVILLQIIHILGINQFLNVLYVNHLLPQIIQTIQIKLIIIVPLQIQEYL